MAVRRALTPHGWAVVQALLVTFLWSTSWVLVKIGLQNHVPALTFAGLRYTLAFICLAPLVLLKAEQRQALRGLSGKAWGQLALLGVVFYTLTQGAQFLSLAFLPAAMVSLLLNSTPVGVALLGGWLLRERLTPLQWGGIGVLGIGLAIYFAPTVLPPTQLWGVLVAIIGVCANAGAALLGRYVNQQRAMAPLLVTFVSMGVGAPLLLAVGLIFQGLGSLTGRDWGIIVWLAVINTAFAFTLWNHTLRTLSAVESSILNGLMLPQIALLAWLFLGEALTLLQLVGLVCVGGGALLVQLQRRPQAS